MLCTSLWTSLCFFYTQYIHSPLKRNWPQSPVWPCFLLVQRFCVLRTEVSIYIFNKDTFLFLFVIVQEFDNDRFYRFDETLIQWNVVHIKSIKWLKRKEKHVMYHKKGLNQFNSLVHKSNNDFGNDVCWNLYKAPALTDYSIFICSIFLSLLWVSELYLDFLPSILCFLFLSLVVPAGDCCMVPNQTPWVKLWQTVLALHLTPNSASLQKTMSDQTQIYQR